jgi:hypothetical protein
MAANRGKGGRPAGPPQEKKAPAGPVLTPQVLGVIIFVLLVIGVSMYYTMVIKKSNETKATISSNITTAQTNAQTYEKKGKKLEIARKLNTAVRDKLKTVAYMFMTDQNSVIPFWEDEFFPILDSSNLTPSGDSKIWVEEYTFQINMAMTPFETLPPSTLFENAEDTFPIQYHGEKGGVPETEPIDTRPGTFLTPYQIKLEKFVGTYEDVKDFIEDLQVKQNKSLYTVHCFKNDEAENFGLIRTFSAWDIALTVYFINLDSGASGDQPPAPPGSESC